MAEFNDENKTNGVFGGVEFGGTNGGETAGTFTNAEPTFKKVEAGNLPTKPSIWSKIRSFLFQEIDWTAPIKVELTPYQQKVEDEINEFLHQEISFKGFWNLVVGK